MDTILGSICDVLVVCISLANLIYLVWVRQQDKREQAVREEAEKKYIYCQDIVTGHIDQFRQRSYISVPTTLGKLKNEHYQIIELLYQKGLNIG